MIKESFVESSIRNWLKTNGWIVPARKTIHGIDIKCRHSNGCQYIIECKEETKAPNVSYNESLGQIISQMTHKSDTNYYGIAFPDTKRYRNLVNKKLPEQIRKRLKLRIIFVNDDGKINEIKSSQKKA